MPNNMTNEGMPKNSHCIEEIELHSGTSKCFSADYYIVENVTYPIVVNDSDTSNTISFDYDHVTVNANCDETHDRGSDSMEIKFLENDDTQTIGHISSFDYNGTEVPYYFSQKGVACNVITYTAPEKTYINTNYFNPTTHNFNESTREGTFEQTNCFTSIPTYAFYKAGGGSYDPYELTSNMTSITLPPTITSIGSYAFQRSKLMSCNFGKKPQLITIGTNAFYECRNLTSIVIPDSVTSIGHGAFINCTSLTTCTIGDGVRSIDNYMFTDCTSLTTCTIGNGVRSIGDYVFNGCISLTSIVIPDSVTSIGNYAFYNCSGLTSIVIPDGVTSIGSGTFTDCTSLTTCTIGDGVRSIGGGTFSYCSSLTTCTIGDGVTSIGNHAFYICNSLTSIDIPNSVTSIGQSAFYGCRSLTSITINAVTPPTLGSDAFANTNDCPIYVPAESVEAYKTRWSNYASRIQAMP
jgi:hypothetical protein